MGYGERRTEGVGGGEATVPDIVGGLVGIGLLVLWLYCIYDVITTQDALVRHLPKIVWLLIVVLLSDLGSFLWLAFGRPVGARRTHEPRRSPAPRLRMLPPPSPVEDRLDHLNPIVRYREEQTRRRMLEAQRLRREESADGDREGGGATR